LREILELLRNRIELALFTLFVKIKSRRGKFFNEMADRWADKGRDTETHQEITCEILCRLILNDTIIHIKFLNDIIMFPNIV